MTYVSVNTLLLRRAAKLFLVFCREEMPQGVYLEENLRQERQK